LEIVPPIWLPTSAPRETPLRKPPRSGRGGAKVGASAPTGSCLYRLQEAIRRLQKTILRRVIHRGWSQRGAAQTPASGGSSNFWRLFPSVASRLVDYTPLAVVNCSAAYYICCLSPTPRAHVNGAACLACSAFVWPSSASSAPTIPASFAALADAG